MGGRVMAEYIEREATIELLRSLGSRDYRREKGTIQDAIKMVSFSEYTPAADVAPVVRCKDCKHSWEDIGGLTCSHGVCVDCAVLADFYCAYGERKDGADAEG